MATRLNMNYSAAFLVKRSTKQLNHFIRHAPPDKTEKVLVVDPFEKLPSERQIKGNEHAESKAQSPYVEMLGVFNHKDIFIYFAVDEFRRKRYDYLIEHKWLEDQSVVEDWFFKQSLIQSAFLGALATFTKEFKTAGYVTSETKHTFKLKDNFYTRLHFGDKEYDIKFQPIPIMRFFLTKARCAKKYSLAKRFDSTYRFKEWDDYFKDHIKYRKL
jgi:hypothetical protein